MQQLYHVACRYFVLLLINVSIITLLAKRYYVTFGLWHELSAVVCLSSNVVAP